MLVEVKNGVTRYIRESLKDWFLVDVSSVFIYKVSEGERIMPFYLPVYREYYKDSWTCAVMPIVPFVLLYVALKNGFMAAYKDLVFTIDQWKHFSK